MKKTTLLVIEGRHAEIPSFANDLQKKGFDIRAFQNGSQAVSKLKQINPAMVSRWGDDRTIRTLLWRVDGRWS